MVVDKDVIVFLSFFLIDTHNRNVFLYGFYKKTFMGFWNL